MAIEDGTPRRTVQGTELEKFAATIRDLRRAVEEAKRAGNSQVIESGPTANRPVDAEAGHPYLDLTINKPIWSKGSNVWIDATGATV